MKNNKKKYISYMRRMCLATCTNQSPGHSLGSTSLRNSIHREDHHLFLLGLWFVCCEPKIHCIIVSIHRVWSVCVCVKYVWQIKRDWNAFPVAHTIAQRTLRRIWILLWPSRVFFKAPTKKSLFFISLWIHRFRGMADDMTLTKQ